MCVVDVMHIAFGFTWRYSSHTYRVCILIFYIIMLTSTLSALKPLAITHSSDGISRRISKLKCTKEKFQKYQPVLFLRYGTEQICNRPNKMMEKRLFGSKSSQINSYKLSANTR